MANPEIEKAIMARVEKWNREHPAPKPDSLEHLMDNVPKEAIKKNVGFCASPEFAKTDKFFKRGALSMIENHKKLTKTGSVYYGRKRIF